MPKNSKTMNTKACITHAQSKRSYSSRTNAGHHRRIFSLRSRSVS